MEVNRVHDDDSRAEPVVNKVHPLPPDMPLHMAKARMGAAVKKAIEGRAQKEFGSKSLISEVCSGEKVPDYLARIYADKRCRRRLARALVADDSGVVRTMVMSFPDDDGDEGEG